MSLPSLQLDAFVAVAKAQNFSRGARALHITQSALSQRILNLEQSLGLTLFIRDPSGIRLTEAGRKLLRYCQMKDSLEEEFLGSVSGPAGKQLSGLVRIGGFSTVVRSVILPSISALLAENPSLQVEFLTREMRELPGLLETGQADFILLNRPYEKQGVVNVELGFEENVLVEPKGALARDDVFLDHDAEDSTTEDFFQLQNKAPKKWRRSFFDEIYAILDGVAAGAGRAVIPLHLVNQAKGVVVSKGYRSMKSPVYLCYYQQAFYTALQRKVIEAIEAKAPKLLKA